MEKIYILATAFATLCALACFIAFFYMSIRTCFAKNYRKKGRLFLVCFFTNPLIDFYLLTYPITFIYLLVKMMGTDMDSAKVVWETDVSGSIVIFVITALILFMLQFLFAWIMSKWLRVRHPSLVLFVYLMFFVQVVFSFKDLKADMFSEMPYVTVILSVAEFILSYLALFLFYFLVIKGLSRLTDRPFKTSWKVFILPPALFSLLYGSLVVPFNSFYSGDAKILLYVFTTIIMFLFVWAFDVIIKNISATGDALEAKEDIKTLSVEVMEALAHTIDAKDEYTKGHSVRVAKYSRMLAEKMGLSAEECENVYYMGLLHDIGKIGVPNEIINSKTKLTDEEYDVIKTHPGLGYDILAEIKSRPDLCIGAHWHHERFDGKGYPDGKNGEDIPLPARIIAVADSYDAMTSNRSYRDYLPQEKVRDELEKNRGTQFDPQIVEAMLKIMDEDEGYSLHE